MHADPDATEFIFKVAVLGDYRAGKTTLVKTWESACDAAGTKLLDTRTVPGNLPAVDTAQVNATVGVDMIPIVVRGGGPDGSDAAVYRMQCWDVAASERATSVGETSRRNAAAAVILCDTAVPASISAVEDVWLPLATAAGIPQTRTILIANTIGGARSDSDRDSSLRQLQQRFGERNAVSVQLDTGMGAGLALRCLSQQLGADFVRPVVASSSKSSRTPFSSSTPIEQPRPKPPSPSASATRAPTPPSPDEPTTRAVEPHVVRVDTTSSVASSDRTSNAGAAQGRPRRKEKQKSGPCCC